MYCLQNFAKTLPQRLHDVLTILFALARLTARRVIML